jgi:hypothetical protein
VHFRVACFASSARRSGEPPDYIFFVILEGRGINFVEHGKHLPEFVEGNANDQDLIASLK